MCVNWIEMAGLHELRNLAGITSLEEVEMNVEMLFHSMSLSSLKNWRKGNLKNFPTDIVITLTQLFSLYMRLQSRGSPLNMQRKFLIIVKFITINWIKTALWSSVLAFLQTDIRCTDLTWVSLNILEIKFLLYD